MVRERVYEEAHHLAFAQQQFTCLGRHDEKFSKFLKNQRPVEINGLERAVLQHAEPTGFWNSVKAQAIKGGVNFSQ